MIFIRLTRAVALVAVGALAGSCSAPGVSSPSPADGGTTATGGSGSSAIGVSVTVTIQGNSGSQSYNPSPVTMSVGQTIAWHNADSIAHTATGDGGGFDTGNVGAGATSKAIMMNTAGTFTYHCTIHPGMVGTVTVQ